mgnify:FL=1
MENNPIQENEYKKFGIPIKEWRLSVLILFTILMLGGIMISLIKGAVDISYQSIYQALFSGIVGTNEQIIYNIRLPRTIVGLLVGMNLALSGAILQAIMRNPLADPHIIGISSGAGLAGVTIMILFPAMEYLITPVAFIGAMLAAVCIYILAWKGGIRPVRIILAGVAVSAFLGSGISALMIFYLSLIHI